MTTKDILRRNGGFPASNGPGHTRVNLVAYLLADPRVSEQERRDWRRALWLADRLDEEAGQ